MRLIAGEGVWRPRLGPDRALLAEKDVLAGESGGALSSSDDDELDGGSIWGLGGPCGAGRDGGRSRVTGGDARNYGAWKYGARKHGWPQQEGECNAGLRIGRCMGEQYVGMAATVSDALPFKAFWEFLNAVG